MAPWWATPGSHVRPIASKVETYEGAPATRAAAAGASATCGAKIDGTKIDGSAIDGAAVDAISAATATVA
jgi:hypothetical protein